MNRNPLEILFDNVLAGAAYASQSSDSASVKEWHMDNVNHRSITRTARSNASN